MSCLTGTELKVKHQKKKEKKKKKKKSRKWINDMKKRKNIGREKIYKYEMLECYENIVVIIN